MSETRELLCQAYHRGVGRGKFPPAKYAREVWDGVYVFCGVHPDGPIVRSDLNGKPHDPATLPREMQVQLLTIARSILRKNITTEQNARATISRLLSERPDLEQRVAELETLIGEPSNEQT